MQNSTLLNFSFRRAEAGDVDRIVPMVEDAKVRMAAAGLDQWQRGYPNRTSIELDVKNRVAWVLCEGEDIAAYGAIIFTGEPAYDHITAGRWLSGGPYAVVHRLCVAQNYLGRGCSTRFMEQAMSYASEKVSFMRIDTHPDNKIMQHLFDRLGFAYCGDVVIESRRLAYEKRIG